MGVQLTPGQRCLLEILQRKLIRTLKEYARVNQERDSSIKNFGREKLNSMHDRDLIRLREKIKRISGRQKRFTSEIVNGNGNNTIPKESYLRALGLVTRETLQQINSKSNERRRRTTANPRFSHEAIQAKKALQKPRLEPRATRERRNAAATAAAAATVSESTRNNNKQSGKNDGQQTSGRNNRKGASATSAGENSSKSNSGAYAANETSAISRTNPRQQKASPDEQLTEQDRTNFYNNFKQLGIYFQLRAEEIRTKLKSKEELDDDLKLRAMLLREFNGKSGCNIDILEQLFGSSSAARTQLEDMLLATQPDRNKQNNLQSSSSSSISSPTRSTNLSSSCSSVSTSPQPPPTQTNSLATKPGDKKQTRRNPAAAMSAVSPPQLENWMRCDESLDGLS